MIEPIRLTKQHFEFIANVVDQIGNDYVIDDRQHEIVAQYFADALQQTNTNFNRIKFMDACGVEQ
jgi:hypothetical protein